MTLRNNSFHWIQRYLCCFRSASKWASCWQCWYNSYAWSICIIINYKIKDKSNSHLLLYLPLPKSEANQHYWLQASCDTINRFHSTADLFTAFIQMDSKYLWNIFPKLIIHAVKNKHSYYDVMAHVYVKLFIYQWQYLDAILSESTWVSEMPILDLSMTLQ